MRASTGAIYVTFDTEKRCSLNDTAFGVTAQNSLFKLAKQTAYITLSGIPQGVFYNVFSIFRGQYFLSSLQGPISWTIFPSQLKFDGKLFLV